MKTIISDHIARAEKLLSTDPNNKLVKTYLINLKKLKNVPNARLSSIEEAITEICEALKEEEQQDRNKAIMKLFTNMVNNTTTAAAYDKSMTKVSK